MKLHRALHELQERLGYLPRTELVALAEGLGEPLHRLNELVTSFPHYRLSPPAPVEVKVCRDLACHLGGAIDCRRALDSLAREVGGNQIHVDGASCLGRCDHGTAVVINDHVFWGLAPAEYRRLAQTALHTGSTPDESPPDRSPAGWLLDPYQGHPTYKAVPKFLQEWEGSGERLIAELKASDLRGMGGAGQWAHKKWSDVWQASGDEKYVVCNADESEPATFKDREILQRAPHLVIEGMALAAALFGARQGIIYIRHEYHAAIEITRAAIESARSSGFLGPNAFGPGRPFNLEVFVSPGGYICGEQGALIEAIEDRRAEPRNRPPQLETNGLYDKPTLLSNVETFAWAPSIVLNGGDWYASLGQNGSKGRRLFSICGDLERPGVYELPIGAPLSNLIEQAGGVRSGRRLKALAPSGPSGGLVPAAIPVEHLPPRLRDALPPDQQFLDLLSLKLDIDEFRRHGLMLGAGLVVLDDTRDAAEIAVNATQFYRNESCGKCVPCRIGSQKLAQLGEQLLVQRPSPEAQAAPRATVEELLSILELTSICGLGMSAAKPLSTLFQFFPDDLHRTTGRPTESPR
jgi:NADH:ubiquinone oxidoreductase subunit F (NADH-binding)/NADH:ubiquinone oxidoreductase subunit E